MDARPNDEVMLTVVLNAMGRLELAELGFRSWMLQKWDRPYQIVLSLFNDQQPRFEALTAGKNPNCQVIIRSYDKPAHFNISAANNLGLHFATGKFVMFANSDIIYPSNFANRFIGLMEQQGLGYAVASRCNLSEQESKALGSAANYTMENNFDFIESRWSFVEWAKEHDIPPIWPTCGPWTVLRDVAWAIGGFDPAVLVSEDDDLTSRAIHYMARHGGQSTSVCFIGLLGYHLYHPVAELFVWHREAHLIIDARRDRLRRDPQSTDDIVPTNLDDLESLKEAVRNTPKPPPLKKYREDTFRKVSKRVTAAAKILMGLR